MGDGFDGKNAGINAGINSRILSVILWRTTNRPGGRFFESVLSSGQNQYLGRLLIECSLLKMKR
ncbi:MAG: hypothetical protein COU10_00140 [Candidatus Harrisonbacteria bacterium CG10_big_fil_rev_8_21_14_0_10_45_28]|uniref:Uncharacterized protein n=1 Tax=Candidatus Harrisonbacteria bacterium CG10_big_fil_rev_8_21_14_0_10_45_28 TaxID=1974586 RepID=A0A2H0UPC0_9BACT|nr:MAG: hypothetical protein COU10_00140 [Candidatus Harrisonbacteria bacterium CG10_big_fil_rev_8_21_14_0_10_45_28]